MSDTCGVCGEELNSDSMSRCSLCGRQFHMTWNTDKPVDNCGQIWFDPRSTAMGFVCNICVEENPWIKDAIIQMDQPQS